ncbi:hypothetical protein AAVH_23091, partial [Aphelenchoides avenae]
MPQVHLQVCNDTANAAKSTSSKETSLPAKYPSPPVPVKQRKRLYILLLGATGSGKSTFINMIACCTTFKTIVDACSASGPLYAVPAEITIWNSGQDGDDDDDFKTVRVGPVDPQERFGPGSNTQDVRFYR